MGKGGDGGILQKQLWTEDQSFGVVSSYSGSIVNLPGPRARCSPYPLSESLILLLQNSPCQCRSSSQDKLMPKIKWPRFNRTMLLRSQEDALNRLKVFSDCSWHVSKKMLRCISRQLLNQVFFVGFHGLDCNSFSGTANRWERPLVATSGMET